MPTPTAPLSTRRSSPSTSSTAPPSALALLLAVLLSTLAPSTARADDRDEPVGPSKELIESTVEALEAVLEDGDFEAKVVAIGEAAVVHHDDVADAIDEAVDDDALEVRVAAVEALGTMPVEGALDALHKRAKKKKSMEPVEQAVAIIKAIAQHGDASSIAILEDDVIGADDALARARILGLGRIRHEDSVEALMGIMNKLRVGKRGGGHKNMAELRLALHVLTGADEGLDRRRWQSWWNDSKRDLEISATQPELDRKLERQWQQFWEEREERRERDDADEDEDAPPGTENGGESDGENA